MVNKNDGVKIIIRAFTQLDIDMKRMERFLKLSIKYIKKRYSIDTSIDVIPKNVIYYYLSFDDFLKVFEARTFMLTTILKENLKNNSKDSATIQDESQNKNKIQLEEGVFKEKK
jgi:hypothetical protein